MKFKYNGFECESTVQEFNELTGQHIAAVGVEDINGNSLHVKKSGLWSDEMDKELARLVKTIQFPKYGRWKKIAETIDHGKTPAQCQQRYIYLKKNNKD